MLALYPAVAAVAAPTASPAVVRQTLPSGLHLLIAPRPQSRLVAIEVRVRGGGSGSETPEQNGLAHAVEHMVFKGSETRPPGTFDAAFETLGGEVIAQTDRSATVFRVCVLPERFAQTVSLLAEMLARPAFRTSDWNRERLVIAQEMGVAQSDPVKSGLQAVARAAYPPGDPWAQPIMGTPANVLRFTPADLQAFHAGHYAPAHLTVAICGAVTAEAAVQAVGAAFPAPETALSTTKDTNGEKGSDVPVPGAPSPSETLRPLWLKAPAETQTARDFATVFVAYPLPDAGTDAQSIATADVLAALLARGANGLLPASLLAEPQPVALSADADCVWQNANAVLVLQATVPNESVKRAENAIAEVLDALGAQLAGGDTATLAGELDAAKQSVIADQRYRRGTCDGEAQYLAWLDVRGAPPETADGYADAVRAVRFEALLRLLDKHVTPAKRVVAVVGAAGAKSEATP